MSDDYIPWWIPADDPRRIGVQGAAALAETEGAPVVEEVSLASVPVVTMTPETEADTEAARAYVDSQGSE